jgi:outer membrane murein-binding lipoprotein Lpp
MEKIATNLNFKAKPNLTEGAPSPRYTILGGAASMIAKTTGLSDLMKARKAYQTKNYSGAAGHIALSAIRLTVIAVAVFATLQAWNLQKEKDLLNTQVMDLAKDVKDVTAKIDALNQKITLTKTTIQCFQNESQEAQRQIHNCRGAREYYLGSFCDFVVGNSFTSAPLYSNSTECLVKHHTQIATTDGPKGGWIGEIPPFPDKCKIEGV